MASAIAEVSREAEGVRKARSMALASTLKKSYLGFTN